MLHERGLAPHFETAEDVWSRLDGVALGREFLANHGPRGPCVEIALARSFRKPSLECADDCQMHRSREQRQPQPAAIAFRAEGADGGWRGPGGETKINCAGRSPASHRAVQLTDRSEWRRKRNQMEGEVFETCQDTFSVKLQNDHIVTAHISADAKTNRI